jgi:hypothetical protein
MDQERKEFWTVKELAEAAGLTGARVRQLLARGDELRGRKVAGAWLVRDSEARRWLKERRRSV